MKLLAAVIFLALAGCATTNTGFDPGEFGRVRIVGNTSIPRDDLLEAAVDHLHDYLERNVGKSAVDDAAYRIELTYRARGYAFAVVDYTFESKGLSIDNDARDVVFLVDEGPRVVLTELELEGREALSPGRMRAIVLPITGEPGRAPFVRRALEDAVSAVLQEARADGYADARADFDVLDLERESGTGRARIELNPGVRNVIDSIELTGDADAERAREELDKSVGKPFEPRGAAAMLARFEERLRDAGYPDAHAEIAERTVVDGRVRLVLHVLTGERVVIRDVRFEGELETTGAYLQDLVDIRPGARYSAAEIRSASQRIYASGLFARVQHRLEPSDGGARDLVFELVELPSLELWVEPGWGSYDGPRARAGLREHKLLGTGGVVRCEGTASS
jgi:outer membrane protein insertion porin family